MTLKVEESQITLDNKVFIKCKCSTCTEFKIN